MRIDFRIAKNDQSYFVIIANNGEVIAKSEEYHNFDDCFHTAKLIKEHAAEATFTVNGKEVN